RPGRLVGAGGDGRRVQRSDHVESSERPGAGRSDNLDVTGVTTSNPVGYFIASMPAWAIWASCWEVTPETPTEPMILPSATMGMTPSRTLEPMLSRRRGGAPCDT